MSASMARAMLPDDVPTGGMTDMLRKSREVALRGCSRTAGRDQRGQRSLETELSASPKPGANSSRAQMIFCEEPSLDGGLLKSCVQHVRVS